MPASLAWFARWIDVFAIVSAPMAPCFRPPAGGRVTFLEWPRKVTQRGHPDRRAPLRGCGRRGRGLRQDIPVLAQTVGIHASPATRPCRPHRPHGSTGPREIKGRLIAVCLLSSACRSGLNGLAHRCARTRVPRRELGNIQEPRFLAMSSNACWLTSISSGFTGSSNREYDM
jgi:hypothetical protein